MRGRLLDVNSSGGRKHGCVNLQTKQLYEVTVYQVCVPVSSYRIGCFRTPGSQESVNAALRRTENKLTSSKICII